MADSKQDNTAEPEAVQPKADVPSTFITDPTFDYTDVVAENRAVITGPSTGNGFESQAHFEASIKQVFGKDGVSITYPKKGRVRVDLMGEAYALFKTAYDRQLAAAISQAYDDRLSERAEALKPGEKDEGHGR